MASVFGPGKKLIATKGYTGHLLGACGATEIAITIAALEQGAIPPSLGADPVDESLPVQVLQEPQQTEARYVVSNSFAFGGNNVSVVIGRAD